MVAGMLVASSVLVPISHLDAAPNEHCDRPLLIGVRGSGETTSDHSGFGATVAIVADRYRSLIDRKVDVIAIDYPAASINTLFSDVATNGDAYRESVEIGVEKLRSRVNRAATCKQRPIVLVGYSQGALVVNRTLLELMFENSPAILRIAAVELIADPQRLGGAPYTEGTASPERNGISSSTGYYPPYDVPEVLHSRVDSFCRSRDQICALDPTVAAALATPVTAVAAAVDASARHTGYKNTEIPRDAGTFAASRTRHFLKNPPPNYDPIDTRALYNAELPRDVCAANYVQGLPTPLRLTDGEVLGIPDGYISVTGASQAIGDFDGDGVADGAIAVSCNAGGTAVEQDVVVYTARRGLIGRLPFDEIQTSENRTPTVPDDGLSVTDGELRVHWFAGTPEDCRCYSSINVVGRFRVRGRKVEVVHPEPWSPGHTVSTAGYGPITFGMSLDDASLATGTGWHDEYALSEVDTTGRSGARCTYYAVGGVPDGVQFMVVGDTVVRVDITTNDAVRTKSGLGIGSTEAEILAAVPSAVVSPHDYTDGHYVTVTETGNGNKVVFVTDGSRVIEYHAGQSPEAEYIEGCL